VSDIDTGVVVSLKVLDPDGRLEKRTNSRHLDNSALCPISAQFKDISIQVVVAPTEYESGKLIYPYEKALASNP
jgi:hypothetical protein